ncbi:MAG TPA: hypothetical protein VD905_10350 [Flavobacteriales bacterium]|nr:hypothetical protein [Flavobacteriales bacterium]
MKQSLPYILVLVLFACGEGQKGSNGKGKEHTDTVHPEDTNKTVATDTLYPEERNIDLGTIPVSMGFQDRLKFLKTKYEVNYEEIHPDDLKVEVLDRFACEKKFIFHLQKKMPVKYGDVENVFPIAHFHAYLYEDSAQCANAVNNWYNCFGNDCAQVSPGVDATLKTTPGFYIVNPNSIVCLDYALEHAENNWETLINHMRALFETSLSTIIRIKPHGKLVWEK